MNYMPRMGLNHEPPDLSLSSRLDRIIGMTHQHPTPSSSSLSMFLFVVLLYVELNSKWLLL
jgi:hypothetical protein